MGSEMCIRDRILAMPEVQVDFVKDKARNPKPVSYHPEMDEVMKKLEQCTQEMQLLKNRCDDKDRELDKMKREIANSQKENFKPRDSFQFGNKQVEPPRCWHCGSSQHFRAQCPESRRGSDMNHRSSEYLNKNGHKSEPRWMNHPQKKHFGRENGSYRDYQYRTDSGTGSQNRRIDSGNHHSGN